MPFPFPLLLATALFLALAPRCAMCAEPAGPAAPESSLPADEQSRFEEAIRQLDADEFAKRQAAQTRLIAMGPKIQPLLAQRLAEAGKKGDLSAEVQVRLSEAIQGIANAEMDAFCEALNNAVIEAPAQFVPPDPETLIKLQRKISFEFVDSPFRDALAFIGKHAGVPIVVDPVLVDLPVIHLKVADMDSHLSLNWVLKLADLEHVVRAKAVIVTTEARAKKLRLQTRTVVLPVAEGDAPWTLEETETLAELAKEWPASRVNQGDADETFVAVRLEVSAASGAGKILLHGDRGELEDIEKFLTAGAHTPMKPPDAPAWELEVEKKLEEKIVLSVKDMPLDKVLDPRVGARITINPHIKILDLPVVTLDAKERTVREIVLEICRQTGLRANYSHSALFLTTPDNNQDAHFFGLLAKPAVLDLRPALKAGAPAEELTQCLAGLLAEARAPKARVLRGRWLAVADPWTLGRAAAVVEGAAKTGKVPAAPPTPWFFATFARKGRDGNEK